MITYNPALIGKLLNLAGHPGTPDGEALNSVRKAHSHCSAKSMMLGDVANFVSQDIYFDIVTLPNEELLSKIADLQIALDDAQARIVAQADAIADLRRSEDANISTITALQAEGKVDASTIAALEAEVTSLNETVAQQQDVLAAASAVATDPVVEPATTVIEEPVVEKIVRRRVAAKRTTSTSMRKSTRIVTDELDDRVAGPRVETPQPDATSNTRRWNPVEWARFNVLAALGRATSSIARTLSREFDRAITNTDVGRMRRERWLSPSYGLA